MIVPATLLTKARAPEPHSQDADKLQQGRADDQQQGEAHAATCSHTICLQRFPAHSFAHSTPARTITGVALDKVVDIRRVVAPIAVTRRTEARATAHATHTLVWVPTSIEQCIGHSSHTCLIILSLITHAAGSAAQTAPARAVAAFTLDDRLHAAGDVVPIAAAPRAEA